MRAVRIATAIGMLSAAACADLSSGPDGDAANLNRYVAVGSSISMGVASDGVVAESQQASWPALLAADVGVEFSLPLIASPGCRAPIVAPLLNLRRADNTLITDAPTCAPNSPGVSLPAQNVALYGATAEAAVNGRPSTANPLYARVLSEGQTQFSAMRAQNPTFVSIELGANELLPALSGLPSDANAGSFNTNYTHFTNTIRTQTSAKALLALLPVDLRKFPAVRTSAEIASQRTAFAARNVAVNANCDTSPNYVTLHGKIFPTLITGAVRAAGGLGPADLSCADVPNARDGILTESDFATLNAAAAQINTIITNRAAAGNFATFSLGALYDTAKDGVSFDLNAILASSTPFGSLISLDGIHPTAAGQAVLASAAKAGIIQKYGNIVSD